MYEFERTDDVYRGLDLWMLNDELSEEELRNQICEFKKKGLYSVIARTYNGLKSDYPGKDFMQKMHIIIDEAKKCGLKIVLQAGYMPAAIPFLPERYKLGYIVPVKKESLCGSEKVLSENGNWAYTLTKADATIDMFSVDAVRYYIKRTYEEMWECFKEEFGKTVISIWVDEPRYSPSKLPVSEEIISSFYEKYGYKIEDYLHLLYDEEGDCKKVRYDYFTLLEEKMANSYFKQLRLWCNENNLMFSGHLMGEEYLRTQISQACASMPYYKYFDIPGIDMLRSDFNWCRNPSRGLTHSWHAKMDVERMMYVPPSQCVSASHQAGKEHILCEMFAITSTNLTFRDQMSMFDFFAANGINHQCMHAMFYSIGGFRKRMYPQQFNTYQPFWENFKNSKDYVARVSRFVSMGKPSCDVLVLHPIETAYGLYRGYYDEDDKLCQKEIIDYDNRHCEFLMALKANQINFEYGDMFTMETDCHTKNGEITIGKMTYKTVVLPNIEVLSSKVLKLLCDFAHSGGKVIVMDKIPQRLDGRYNAEVFEKIKSLPNTVFVNGADEVIRELKKCENDFEYLSDEDIAYTVVNRRRSGDKNYFMIYNGDLRSSKKGKLVLDGLNMAVRYDAQSGKTHKMYSYEENGKTVIEFENQPGSGTLIYTEPAKILPKEREKPKAVKIVPVENFGFEAKNKNLLTLEYCSYKTTGDFSKEYVIERVVDKLKTENYTGDITLRFKFLSDFEAENLSLVIEEPEKCKIIFNSVEVPNKPDGYFFSKSFKTVKLPGKAVKGENIIEISRFTTPGVSIPAHKIAHLFELFSTPKGVDLERIHILGDFSVNALRRPSKGGLSRYSKSFMLTPPKKVKGMSDMTSCGYPFYTGESVFTSVVSIDEKFRGYRDIRLCIEKFNACTSNVFVNGKKVGSIDRDPFSVSVKDSLIEGENEIKIQIFNTLRNAIGPSHFKNKDVASCSNPAWTGEKEEYEYENDRDSRIWTVDFELVPYGIGGVTLKYIE